MAIRPTHNPPKEGLGALPATGTTNAPEASPSQQPETQSAPHNGYKATSDAPEAAVYRLTDKAMSVAGTEDFIDKSQSIARRARDAFRESCEADEEDQAETSFLAAKHKLQELWEYAAVRDRPFRDLLGLLDAATRYADLPNFTPAQRDILRQAFADLPRLYLGDDLVKEHIHHFAEHGVDILGPIRPTLPKRIEVTFRELE
jgi:hypothetical protein